jgi:serine/threonine-protein kinase
VIHLLRGLLAGPHEALSRSAAEQPPELVAVCEKAMSREPADRYRDMGELGDDLRAYLEHNVVTAYRSGRMAELHQWAERDRAPAGVVLAVPILLVGAH